MKFASGRFLRDEVTFGTIRVSKHFINMHCSTTRSLAAVAGDIDTDVAVLACWVI